MATIVIGVLVIWDVKFRLCYQAVDFQWRRMTDGLPCRRMLLISAANLISTMIRWLRNLCVWSRLTDCFPIGCQHSKCLKTELTSGKTVMLPKCRKSTENKHFDPKAELRYAREPNI